MAPVKLEPWGAEMQSNKERILLAEFVCFVIANLLQLDNYCAKNILRH